MPSLARFLILSTLLLGLFLAVAVATQGWLQRQGARLQTEAIETRRAQFLKAVELTRPGNPPWTQEQLAALGQVIDADVKLMTSVPDTDPVPADRILFVQSLPAVDDQGTVYAVVSFAAPPLLRIQLAHARTWALLLILALGVLLLFVTVSTIWQRTGASGPDSRTPLHTTRSEINSLEHLARTSVAQGSALAKERDAHLRTEQDLLLNQRLLNQSLEEKIRLGRDLHDGLIQSLYAAGLTLESIRPLLSRDPTEADQRLERCRDQLNVAIRDVRNYITGLSPDKLRRLSFAAALELFMQELRAGRKVEFSSTIDEEAASALTSAQTVETLQIAREAISNSLRHGRSNQITVRLHRSGQEVGLLVQDDGIGFDPAGNESGGYGLGNMRARADHLGASLRIDSRIGDGTRVVATIPVGKNHEQI